MKGKPVLIFLALLIVLSAVYAPVFTSYYAHHDDYVYFVRGQNYMERHPFWEGEFSNGRYLAAVFYTLSGWAVNSVWDLNLLRLVSIGILALCGLTCFSFFHRYLKSDLQALLSVVSLLTLPPFGVLVSWALNVSKAPALVFTCAAFSAVAGGVRVAPVSGKAITSCEAGAVFLFLCALGTYPPAAMFYWFLLALWIVVERPGISTVHFSVRPFFVVGFISMGLYFGIVHFLKTTFGTLTNTLYNPYALTTDYVGKIRWFLQEPLKNAENLWNIFPHPSTACFVLLIIGGGVLVALSRLYGRWKAGASVGLIWKYLLINPLLILVLLILSFLPNLLAVGNAAFYRCSAALTSIVFILFLWAAVQMANVFSEQVRRNIIFVILLLTACCGAYHARFNILNYRIIPSHRELVYVKARLRRPDLYKFHHVHFIRPDEAAYQTVRRYDEFGVPSTHYRQNISLILKCALREIGLEPFFWHFYPRITQSRSPMPPPVSDVLVIDMTKMETSD